MITFIDTLTHLDADLLVVSVLIGGFILKTITSPQSNTLTIILSMGFAALVSSLIVRTQTSRDAAAQDASSKVTDLEASLAKLTPDMVKEGFHHRLDGERYAQRVNMPVPEIDVAFRAIRKRPVVAQSLGKLIPHISADRSLVTRIMVILEDFYARIDALKNATPSRIADNGRILRDARSDVLNAMASLEWTGPRNERSVIQVRRARHKIQKQTLSEIQRLVQKHSKSPYIQAADWKPPYPMDDHAVYKLEGSRLGLMSDVHVT